MFLRKLGAELAALGPSHMVELRVIMPSRFRNDGPRVIKLMADYYCHPLWEVAPEIDNIDPSTLPISDSMQAALRAWATTFDETLDQDYPPDSGFADPEQRAAFEAEGHRLWRKLQRELGEQVRVVYYSEREQRVLEPARPRNPEPEDD
jgi:hypothetical protein